MYWIPDNIMAFPQHKYADEHGILAIGGALTPDWLLLAYWNGIFPWFNDPEPIVWWSPDPRFVLFPDELKISKSMRPYFNQKKFEVTYDTVFEEVIKNCSKVPRQGQGGETWINQRMIKAYGKMHELGYAHSVEVWQEKELVGGLYGIALGKVFFGESMFMKASNASKFALISLVSELKEHGFQLIDCQQETKHLASLGARSIQRKEFLEILEKNRQEDSLIGNWGQILR